MFSIMHRDFLLDSSIFKMTLFHLQDFPKQINAAIFWYKKMFNGIASDL